MHGKGGEDEEKRHGNSDAPQARRLKDLTPLLCELRRPLEPVSHTAMDIVVDTVVPHRMMKAMVYIYIYSYYCNWYRYT